MVPPRTFAEISNEYEEIEARYHRAATQEGRIFHRAALNGLQEELAQLRNAGTTPARSATVGNASNTGTVNNESATMEDADNTTSDNHSADTH